MRWSPEGDNPVIGKSSYVDRTAVIIGKVFIGENVFVGPGAVVRADEPGSSITIKDNSNVQDNTVIHSFEKSHVIIDEKVSIAHGAIIHGPAKIGNSLKCFISKSKNSYVGTSCQVPLIAVSSPEGTSQY